MESKRNWRQVGDGEYTYEGQGLTATLSMSDRPLDADDDPPQIYRYQMHRVRIIDDVTGQEDIYSRPAKGMSVDDEIAWADDVLDRHLAGSQ